MGLVGVSSTLGARYSWQEGTRWLTGCVTLFGVGLLMGLLGYWHLATVLGLGTAVMVTRLLMPLNFWQNREAHRWTAQYMFGFFVGLMLVLFELYSASTWLALFVGLGLAGAIKTGAEGWRDSRQAQKMRKRRERLCGTK